MSEIVKIKSVDIVKKPDIESIISTWEKYLLSERAKETAKAYVKAIWLFVEWLETKAIGLSEVTPPVVREWRDQLKKTYSNQTVNLWLTAVRRFYSWLIEEGVPIENPAREVSGTRRKMTGHKRDELTSREVIRVFKTCENTKRGIRDRAIISLMAYSCMRTVEVHRSDIEDLQTKDDRMILRFQGKGHTEKNDFKVLSPPVEEAINDWLSVRGNSPGALFKGLSNRHRWRLSLRQIRRMVTNRYKLAGIVSGNKTTHSLRHSAISNAIRHGASPLQVQAMAGHQSFDTTLIYLHEVSRTDSPAEDLISYANGINGNGENGK